MMLDRRIFFQSGLAAGAALAMNGVSSRRSSAAEAALKPALPFRAFDVTTEVDLANADGPAQLWLPLFQAAGGYQKLLGVTWEGGGAVKLDRDANFGARLLHARWDDASKPQSIKVVQRVATSERSDVDASLAATAAERAFWTQPGAGLPTDGVVRDTARMIVGNLKDPKEQLRAIYNWVIATTYRDAATPGCGVGNIAAMIKEQRYGGKCADINSLLVGLCRSVGLPARDVYGIRLADSKLFKSLGRSGDITGAQHCRAEVYLESEGWFPVDPADVRKAVLEEKLPVDHPQIVKLAEHLFGAWESNWAGYNSATGITLAGAPHAPNFDFLMYPCAMTAKSIFDCLDAAHFKYKITSQEISI
jgi:transglutaminase-like putative cysteine protease